MKQLKFVHITKTGGTTIEIIGKRNGFLWGMYDPVYAENIGFWHIPFSTAKNLKKLQQEFDWFAVVRNPYQRILSEFYCKWIAPKNKNICTTEFNEFIQSMIKNKGSIKAIGHYQEQHLYTHNLQGEQIVNHIIKYENFQEELETLFAKYNINIKIDEYHNKGKKKFTVDDFDLQTIQLINKVYDKDFNLLGYTKLEI